MLNQQPSSDNTGQNVPASAVDEMFEEFVVTVLTSKDDVTQQAAAAMLRILPTAVCNRFAARLVEMLKSRKKTIRQRAANCLIAMGPIAIQPLFVTLRDSRATSFRIRVAGILAQVLRPQRLMDFAKIGSGLCAILLSTKNQEVATALWDVLGIFRQGQAEAVADPSSRPRSLP